MSRIFLLLLFMNISISVASEKYPAYGGVLSFQDKDDKTYRNMKIWMTCVEKDTNNRCKLVSTVKQRDIYDEEISDKTYILKDSRKIKIDGMIESIAYDNSYMYESLFSTAMMLADKAQDEIEKENASLLIFIPYSIAGLVVDIIKAPVSLPAGFIGEFVVKRIVRKSVQYLFDTSKRNKSKVLFYYNDENNVINDIEHQFSHTLF